MPQVVKQASEAYRQENDWLHAFLRECCDVDSTYREKAGDLYQEYRVYCERMGDFTRSSSDFSNALITAGYVKKRLPKGIFFRGVKLRSEFLM